MLAETGATVLRLQAAGQQITGQVDRSPRQQIGTVPARPANQMATSGPDGVTGQAGVAGAGPGPSRPPRPASATVTLRLLATTDLHANILSYDYAANRPLNGQGLAQMASLIAATRAEVPGALLLDNGDFLQGSALADLAAQRGRRRGHPVIAAMNAIGYDAVTLGNHEFNYGLDVLARALAEARFPIVSANVLRQHAAGGPLLDETLVPPFVILDRVLADSQGKAHCLRLGILGLTPPEITRWDHTHLHGRLATRPMLETAAAWVPEMRRRGADLVVCLAHTGIAEHPGICRSDALAADLAEVPGIDALVLGHSHLVFPNRSLHLDPRVDPVAGTVAGKPAVQPGHSGSHLGVMDLRLRQGRAEDGTGESWSIAGADVRALSVSEFVAGLSGVEILRQSEALRHAVGGDHRAALAWTRRSLGQTELAMSTAFAHVADVPAVRLLSLAKIDHVRRCLAGTEHADLPVLSVTTPYRAGGRGGPLNYTDIAAGPLSVRHVFDLYPFPNCLAATVVTHAQLVEMLERSAVIYRQILPGQPDQMLIDAAYPTYAFDIIHGLSYQVDLTRPARYDARGRLIRPDARRIVGLHRNGLPLHPEARFVLATNSFRASLALGAPPQTSGNLLADRRDLCSDVLRDFIVQTGRIAPETLTLSETWSLLPVAGASVLFDSGPAAMRHMADVAPMTPQIVGLTEEGFHRFRLHL